MLRRLGEFFCLEPYPNLLPFTVKWCFELLFTDMMVFSMACAIREAYAAALTVVILVDDGQKVDNKDE